MEVLVILDLSGLAILGHLQMNECFVLQIGCK